MIKVVSCLLLGCFWLSFDMLLFVSRSHSSLCFLLTRSNLLETNLKISASEFLEPTLIFFTFFLFKMMKVCIFVANMNNFDLDGHAANAAFCVYAAPILLNDSKIGGGILADFSVTHSVVQHRERTSQPVRPVMA